jgi:hypothetical protein
MEIGRYGHLITHLSRLERKKRRRRGAFSLDWDSNAFSLFLSSFLLSGRIFFGKYDKFL